MIGRAELDALDREALVRRAEQGGVPQARLLTKPELVDEILRRSGHDDPQRLRKSRGFFGLARDLLSRVVERGLHLPDAADRLRDALAAPREDAPRPPPEAVPTVTLAEIYARQGHTERAIATLHQVLDEEPDNASARTLLATLSSEDYVTPRPPLPPEDDATPALVSAPAREGPPACVALPDGDDVRVWCRGAEGDAAMVRVVILSPSWDGPTMEVRDIPCVNEQPLRIANVPPRSVVRVAVGVTVDGRFVPKAHSPLFLRAEDPIDASHRFDEWRPNGIVPAELADPPLG